MRSHKNIKISNKLKLSQVLIKLQLKVIFLHWMLQFSRHFCLTSFFTQSWQSVCPLSICELTARCMIHVMMGIFRISLVVFNKLAKMHISPGGSLTVWNPTFSQLPVSAASVLCLPASGLRLSCDLGETHKLYLSI